MKSLIKPSHRGLLHEHLGIPQGEKIGPARLHEATRSTNPDIRAEAHFALNFNEHGHHGEVTSVGAHHSNPKFATVHVAHGKRAKPKKVKGVAVGDYDDRPTSSIVIPAANAGKYHVGQKVGVGAMPLDDGDDMEDDGDMDDAMDTFHSTQRSIASFGNRGRKRS